MIDIKENVIFEEFPAAFSLLLKDQTTQRNILWATTDYEDKGPGYQYGDEIQIDRITGVNGNIIKPRILKGKSEQICRTKYKAEIFTPSWVCNIQNNVTDEAWFGKKGVFNTEDIINNTWTVNPVPITFPYDKDWQDYVSARRIEVTCGEAPYLVSRYDTTSGELIPLEKRIGLLDRKLRVVGENTATQEDWQRYAELAFKNIYGFEWQGDSLLLARESLLFSYMEYFAALFHSKPDSKAVTRIAFIISWNLWQMDGLKYVIPDSCHETRVSSANLFDSTEVLLPCEGCRTNNIHKHNGVYCLIKNWDEKDKDTGEYGQTFRFVDLLK